MNDWRKRMLSLKKARELDIHYKIKKSHLWAFVGERYQPVDDINELPDYQRRQQKSLQTVQNGTPFMNNKRTYAFSPDMDATNNGNDIPKNKKEKMYGVSFQQNKSYASKNKHSQSCLLVSGNKHLEELKVFWQTFESLPTVICLVETWMREGSHEEHFNISGYQKIIAKNRMGIGGGVAMFCREDILLLDSFATNYDESLGIKIRTNNENYTLITFYVPPWFNKNQFFIEFDSHLETMVDANQNLIICGDFNIDQLSLTPIKKRFEDVISSNGINLMDLGITRKTSTTKSSLDLFLTNINKNQCIVNSISYDITDHYPVFFSQTKSMIKPKIKKSKRHSMSAFNNKILFEKYKKELEENLIIFQNNNTDQTFNAFCNCIHFVVDKQQPLVEIKQKKIRSQWVTNRLKNLFAKRNNARTKWLRTTNNIYKNRYLQPKSKSTKKMNNTKKNFIQNKIQNFGRDSRKIYKIINKLIGRNRRSDVSYNLVFNTI